MKERVLVRQRARVITEAEAEQVSGGIFTNTGAVCTLLPLMAPKCNDPSDCDLCNPPSN